MDLKTVETVLERVRQEGKKLIDIVLSIATGPVKVILGMFTAYYVMMKELNLKKRFAARNIFKGGMPIPNSEFVIPTRGYVELIWHTFVPLVIALLLSSIELDIHSFIDVVRLAIDQEGGISIYELGMALVSNLEDASKLIITAAAVGLFAYYLIYKSHKETQNGTLLSCSSKVYKALKKPDREVLKKFSDIMYEKGYVTDSDDAARLALLTLMNNSRFEWVDVNGKVVPPLPLNLKNGSTILLNKAYSGAKNVGVPDETIDRETLLHNAVMDGKLWAVISARPQHGDHLMSKGALSQIPSEKELFTLSLEDGVKIIFSHSEMNEAIKLMMQSFPPSKWENDEANKNKGVSKVVNSEFWAMLADGAEAKKANWSRIKGILEVLNRVPSTRSFNRQ